MTPRLVKPARPDPTFADDLKPTVLTVMGIFLGLGFVAGFIVAMVVLS